MIPPPAGRRIQEHAAEQLRREIARAGGVEVFAIGDLDSGEVTSLTVTCRGQPDRVPALLDRPRAGQVVIHNHPSGDLRASDADLQLAALYGEDGVGVVIVDSEVTRSNWVVEPHRREEKPVDEEVVARFFTHALREALPGYEARAQQIDMALAVARALSAGTHLVVEAGTGTGKSLAYLVPAALWAMANDTKVVVSTYTRALQGQLVGSDLPLLRRGGIEARTAVLLGRNNYLCKRRLALARQELDETSDAEEARLLEDLAAWEATSGGLKTDLPFRVPADTWEEVLSDSALSLSIRCEHYGVCHYYVARRRAAAAHLVVVNHALLLGDLGLRAEGGRGVLPTFGRIVLDEAHHLEEAATGAAARRLTALGVRRAVAPLLDTDQRRGALSRLVRHVGARSTLSGPAQRELEVAVATAAATADAVRQEIPRLAEQIAEVALTDASPVRVTAEFETTERWQLSVAPGIRQLGSELSTLVEALDAVQATFQDLELDPVDQQPLLALGRARQRTADHLATTVEILLDNAGACRWIEPSRSFPGDRGAALCVAPIEVGPTLARLLWEPVSGIVSTSATLSTQSARANPHTQVGDGFHWWRERTGAPELEARRYPSPFDHARQVLLGLPRDLPAPDLPGFLAASSEALRAAVSASDGGAFVLCTSYAAVSHYARVLRDVGGRPILAQGEAGRVVLLERFRDQRRAVLVGTDSFWEGVSVVGEGLRLVVIPRIPFRVPTDPLRVARHEQLAARGRDPFRAMSLPDAAIRLKQGYGRLVRSHTDRGVVLILDRRLHDRPYGRVLLDALPPARRVVGPWRAVEVELRAFFATSSL